MSMPTEEAPEAVSTTPNLGDELGRGATCCPGALDCLGCDICEQFELPETSPVPPTPSPEGQTVTEQMKRDLLQALIRKQFEGCITEIGANKTLTRLDEYNRGWNDASDNAIKFIRRYIKGEGLFQL